MKFDHTKAFIGYIHAMIGHMQVVYRGDSSAFVFNQNEFKKLENNFSNELSDNFGSNSNLNELHQCYRTLLLPNLRKWIILDRAIDIQPKDFVNYPDKYQIPAIQKQVKEQIRALYNLGSKKSLTEKYPLIQSKAQLIVRKKNIKYKAPSSSSDSDTMFNKSFIEIELAGIDGDLPTLSYLETHLQKFLKYKEQHIKYGEDSYYFQRIDRNLDRWLLGKKKCIISRIRKNDAGKPFPYQSIDGIFHYSSDLNFRIRDYSEETVYNETTFETIRSHYETQLTGKNKLANIQQATKLAIEVASTVSPKFHQKCETHLNSLIVLMVEQEKVDQAEGDFIKQIDAIITNEEIEYIEAYKQLCDIQFHIERYWIEAQNKETHPSVNHYMKNARELCESQTDRYSELRKSKRFGGKTTVGVAKEKIKTKLTVDELAYFFRILLDEEIVDCDNKSELSRIVSQNFETANKKSISPDSIRNKMATPSHKAADSMHTRFVRMMQRAGKDKENL